MRALVALGSNLGDRRASLEEGLQALAGLGRVAVSPLWTETPDESGRGPDYLNTVALLETDGDDPRALLEALLRAELRLGRDRAQGRNAPRTLDLDLLLYGEQVLHTPTLTLPHPRLHLRAFVLVPLAEIAPDLALPGRGSVAAWLPAVANQRIEKL